MNGLVKILGNSKYIDTKSGLSEFSDLFYKLLESKIDYYDELCILCIGTDRATGDSLGPIVGKLLSESAGSIERVNIYGTLEAPVHAKNIDLYINRIYNEHKNPLVVAIDAGLGRAETIGFLNFGYGSIYPGAGLNKKLNPVGDIFITGIVNASTGMDFFVLQNTRLAIVMHMANIVHAGVLWGILKLMGFNKR